jgi:hypothetical protein
MTVCEDAPITTDTLQVVLTFGCEVFGCASGNMEHACLPLATLQP